MCFGQLIGVCPGDDAIIQKKKKVTVKLFESKSRHIYFKILTEVSINGV